MKTIKQVADEYGVSVQTIYRKLNNVKQEKGMCLTEKVGGIIRITAKGEEVLTECLTRRLTGVKQVLNNVKHAESEEIAFLRDQVKTLRSELTAERQRSHEYAEKFAVLADQAQKLHAGTMQKQLPPGEDNGESASPLVVPEGFFARVVWAMKKPRE
jgi:transposase